MNALAKSPRFGARLARLLVGTDLPAETEARLWGLVEVPEVAYTAALALLRDLLDAAELEGDRCPLCNLACTDPGEAPPTYEHEPDCPAGRAQLAIDALDYERPEAQAAAVVALDLVDPPPAGKAPEGTP